MTYQEWATAIEAASTSAGLSCTYYQFAKETAPDPPYLVWYFPNRDDFRADNEAYVTVNELNLELYTARKDFALEAALEEELDKLEIVYDKEEQYIESEELYEVLYTTEVIIDGE